MTHAIEFALHPRLAADTHFVADWELSRVLLSNNSNYLWLLLVPRRANLSEIHDLTPADRAILIEEVARASAGLKTLTNAAKINVGALGNIVPQLHVHVVAREASDPAWPGPVWGHGAAEPFDAASLSVRIAELRTCL